MNKAANKDMQPHLNKTLTLTVLQFLRTTTKHRTALIF